MIRASCPGRCQVTQTSGGARRAGRIRAVSVSHAITCLGIPFVQNGPPTLPSTKRCTAPGAGRPSHPDGREGSPHALHAVQRRPAPNSPELLRSYDARRNPQILFPDFVCDISVVVTELVLGPPFVAGWSACPGRRATAPGHFCFNVTLCHKTQRSLRNFGLTAK